MTRPTVNRALIMSAIFRRGAIYVRWNKSGWAPDAAIRKKILVDNPARLYGF
jgi:hypothetical protein